MPILAVDKLVKNYDGFRAVDDVSFTVQKGQVLGLLGPNGAGKSTTIQMVVGITEPSSGTISYFGDDFKAHRQSALQRINFASAYNTLQGRMTVKENLLVFAGLYQVPKPRRKIAELLDYFEITAFADHKYWDLSAGERTRVNLVKALLNDPELILMDEPTASLDPDIADKTLSLIENLRRDRDLSLLFTSHNMFEVSRICDEVIFLDHGKIVSQGAPSSLIKNIKGVELSIQFIGSQAEVEKVLKQHKLHYDFMAANTVSIKTTQEKLAQIIAYLSAQFELIDIETHKPTLADVFLEIARGRSQ